MQKDTKLRILGFFGPLILGTGFAVEAIYYVAFAWWLDPWLARKSNRELVDDIKTNLDFLSSESSSIRVLPADWPTVEIPWGNLAFTLKTTSLSAIAIYANDCYTVAITRLEESWP